MDLTDLEIGMKIMEIIIELNNEKMYRAITNPSRIKIVDVVAKSKKPLSLMELSRQSNFSKTNTMHHIEILGEADILNVKNSEKQQHNPLLISLSPKLKEKLVTA